MPVNGISTIQNLAYQNTKSTSSSDLSSKDVFFQILSAELSNQDPMKGKDGTEYVSQLAQFTTLEQTQQLYSSINKLLMSQSVTEAGMMIGKEVEFGVRGNDGTYKTEKGVVTSVKIDGGQVYLYTKDDKKYLLGDSIGFKEVTPSENTEAKEDSKLDTADNVEGEASN
ncbi:flagellar hook capping FlgD N-terminal domain-containing protein [Clostridium cylindrosporum]|uniref:Flagellar hook capping protein n=1 Tax=Clostridium cylindrosporum DSM 605 TaxID=1121307 RepID=A0A0J8D6J4_CLOCY|nr:flagellar hook capping FlgD N-terminal domain-containing protein [Clostridium cylindrosporum]KMT21705.1 flagellar hook capping protein [Clostridium cylindrosporum DSM 605]